MFSGGLIKTVIPGRVSPQYVEALRLNQIAFLDSITESPETTARYVAAEQAYRESFKKRIKIGLNMA